MLLASTASADDVGITPARLIELSDGGYALEADVPPRMVAALRDPVVPERFTLAEKPIYRRVGVSLVVRYEFSGSDRGLEAGDVLLLPWARSAVLLTARWSDGTVQRAMFPRSAVGIKVPIEILRPVQQSPMEVAQSNVGAELVRPAPMVLRLLLVVALVTAARRRAIGLAACFAAGHALAMVALDLGVPALPTGLAGAVVGLGAALVARSTLRQDHARLWPLVAALGLVDGLGIVGRLIREGTGPAEIVPALFGAAVGVDVVLMALCAGLGLVWGEERRPGLQRALAMAAGSLGVAAAIGLTVSGLEASEELTIDPADRMAAARFEMRQGASPGTATGGRAAARPKRLDDPAMVFLSIEPMEVRAEVLLSLREFLEPLRIDGGPQSIVPVEYQEAIEERARRMVTQTVTVSVDGREAVPLLERSDFVTVSAAGVATRIEPQPEPLATSALGVTLVFGADRPPSEIDLSWRVFPTADTAIPLVWLDPTGSDKTVLTADEPMISWTGDLTAFERRPVQRVAVEPPQWPLVSLGLILLAGVTAWVLRRSPRWRPLLWGAVIVAVFCYPFVRTEATVPGFGGWKPSRAEAASTVEELLTNVYRSFDLRGEEAIYDRLAVSLSGELLTDVYLDNRRALELEERGGARARVDEVDVLEVRSVQRARGGGVLVEAVWVVSASVNHFGHVHYRQNRYDAAITLKDDEGAWRIVGLEMLDQRRLI